VENEEKGASELPKELKSLRGNTHTVRSEENETCPEEPEMRKTLRLALFLCAWMLYPIAFFPLFRMIGEAAFAFSILFPVLAGWRLGVRRAVYVAIVQSFINVWFEFTTGHKLIEVVGSPFIGFVVMLLIGGTLGRLRETTEKIKAEIAERKKIEEKLRKSETQLATAQEISNLGSWEADLQTSATVWSDQLYRIMGLEPQEIKASLHAYLEAIHPDDRERIGSIIQQAITTHQQFAIEHRIIRKDGVERVWSAKGFVSIDGFGRPVKVFGIAQDITERKQAEEERERIVRELLEAIANVKTLSGLVPICSSCKKIRDDKGFWNQLEKYIIEHTGAKFSHGICPECAQKLYPEFLKK